MRRLVRSTWGRLRGVLGWKVRLPSFRLGPVLACLSLLGLVGLAFLLGAAVMHFQIPPAAFLHRAFIGAQAWQERGQPQDGTSPSEGAARGEVSVDRAEKTFDGFTLYTTNPGSRAVLINMHGEVVHQWELSFRKAWPRAPQVPRPIAEEKIHWFRARLFPNGDLLVVFHADGDTPYGYGLVKLNKDSGIVWTYPGNVHHDVDVGEDGTIYTLAHKLLGDPPAGLEFLPKPLIADSLVLLSPEGRELENIPLLEAFRDSPFALMLASVTTDWTRPGPSLAPAPSGTPPLPALPPPPPAPAVRQAGVAPPTPQPVGAAPLSGKGDLLHANGVKVLTRTLAPKFPLFQAGQVLISLRNLDALAVLDTHTRSVTWAARGVWRLQHDPHFLDNGHILIYDNSGWSKGSRVLEYDPVTQALPWAYSNEDSPAFRAVFRGVSQRLPNSNTLIVDPDNGRLFEVTASKELVWEAHCPRFITGAQRYAPDQLPFLKGGVRARP
jgi:hypothetical protein